MDEVLKNIKFLLIVASVLLVSHITKTIIKHIKNENITRKIKKRIRY
jgi:hypothetical protein